MSFNDRRKEKKMTADFNLTLWNEISAVPQKAQKPITGGRMKGFTDINPVWRLKTLTEKFGPVGVGWFTEKEKYWVEPGGDGEIAAFCSLGLRYKKDEEWQESISGIGGSMLVAKESAGLHVNDECFKMAYTDALGVACKALGMGADVYWEKGKSDSKYPNTPTDLDPLGSNPKTCCECGAALTAGQITVSMKNFSKPLCPACQPK